jgi:hypothetical protein
MTPRRKSMPNNPTSPIIQANGDVLASVVEQQIAEQQVLD